MPDGVEAGCHLGNHAGADDAVFDESIQLGGGGPADESRRVGDIPLQSLDICEIDDLLGAEGGADGSGHRVGVDVVGLTGGIGADGGDHRDQKEDCAAQALEGGR